MTDELTLRMLDETVESMFRDADRARPARTAGPDGRLWQALESGGLTALPVPERHGGAGAGWPEAAVLLRGAGRHAISLPVLESTALAGWLLAGAGLALPPGPVTAARGADLRVESRGDEILLSGRLPRVPYARFAEHLVVLADGASPVVASLATAELEITPGVNLADEPRDDVALRGFPVPAGQWAPWPGPAGELLRHRAAAGRTILMAGAASRVLDLTVSYAGQRTQFGRPLARFQAVQQNLARMAGEAAALAAAADGAQLALADFDAGTGAGAGAGTGALARFTARVAAAKCRAGAGAVRIARLAHQVHGAIGYTEEYDLRLFTTRLWAWRAEDGDERYWATMLGRAAVEGGGDVWGWLGDLAAIPPPRAGVHESI